MNPIEIEPEIRALEMMTKDFSKPGDSIAPTTGSAVWALSIRQPWAWLILNAGKDIENRTWPTKFRGHVLLHAAKNMELGEYADAEETLELLRLPIKLPMKHELQRGGIVGEMDIVDCVT